MCAFGGGGRRDLLIATGSRYFSAKDWQEQPLAGSLFMVDVGIAGIPDHSVALSPDHARFG
jgi:sugar lactone lactonase YvrE